MSKLFSAMPFCENNGSAVREALVFFERDRNFPLYKKERPERGNGVSREQADYSQKFILHVLPPGENN